SMKSSVEVRVPFLDKNIIEESWKIFFKIDEITKLKQPLKKLVYQVIPENLMLQEKKGFSVPIEKWFRNQLKNDLVATVINSPLYGNEHFNEKLLKDYVQDFLDGKHNNGWGIWHIYAWQKWAINYDL